MNTSYDFFFSRVTNIVLAPGLYAYNAVDTRITLRRTTVSIIWSKSDITDLTGKKRTTRIPGLKYLYV